MSKPQPTRKNKDYPTKEELELVKEHGSGIFERLLAKNMIKNGEYREKKEDGNGRN